MASLPLLNGDKLFNPLHSNLAVNQHRTYPITIPTDDGNDDDGKYTLKNKDQSRDKDRPHKNKNNYDPHSERERQIEKPKQNRDKDREKIRVEQPYVNTMLCAVFLKV